MFVLYSFPKDFQVEKPAPRVTAYKMSSEKLSLSYSDLDPDPGYDPKKGGPKGHKHEGQEQWMIVLKGEVSFTIGEKTYTLKPRDILLIPPGVMHTAKLGTEGAEIIEILSPPSVSI
jgi:mannose-6-phosphate isomerase-like protein (cupin superfamily)